MAVRFGSHMSIAGGHDRAVAAARAAGYDTVQVFTKSTNQWKARPLVDAEVAAFRAALAEAGMPDPVAHNSYLINLASPDDALWQKSIDAMVIELERAEALGIPDLVAHPGAHMGTGEAAGLDRIAQALDVIHGRTAGFATRIALETTAGQGTCLGHRFEHLGGIVARVASPERLSVCVDTCHVFAAGYSLDPIEAYNATVTELDAAVGLARVRVWHLNDSLKPLGSRVDRHAGIGLGHLGLGPFGHIVNDPRLAHARMILETPKGRVGDEDLDVVNLRVLRGLIATPTRPTRRRA